MSINANFRDIFCILKNPTRAISGFIVCVVYKFYFLNKANNVENLILNIFLAISVGLYYNISLKILINVLTKKYLYKKIKKG